MVGLCNNAFEGVNVTDELERGCKNSDYGLVLNICLKRIRRVTKECEDSGERNPLITR